MTHALSISDLKSVSNEPRVLDIRIGERLGFANPLMIRKLIERNSAELEAHGIISTMEIIHEGRGRPGKEFWLNEGQTLVICMLSRTDAAAAIRKEVIEVYMAYRRSQLVQQAPDPWERISRRQEIVRKAVAFHNESKSQDFAESITHLLTEGKKAKKLPQFWVDIEVRLMVINLHRQVPLDDFRSICLEKFGPNRTPSRSSIGRVWQQLDRVRGSVVPNGTVLNG